MLDKHYPHQSEEPTSHIQPTFEPLGGSTDDASVTPTRTSAVNIAVTDRLNSKPTTSPIAISSWNPGWTSSLCAVLVTRRRLNVPNDSTSQTDPRPPESPYPIPLSTILDHRIDELGRFKLFRTSAFVSDRAKPIETVDAHELVQLLCDLRQEWRHGETPGVYTVKLMTLFGALMNVAEATFDFEQEDEEIIQ